MVAAVFSETADVVDSIVFHCADVYSRIFVGSPRMGVGSDFLLGSLSTLFFFRCQRFFDGAGFGLAGKHAFGGQYVDVYRALYRNGNSTPVFNRKNVLFGLGGIRNIGFRSLLFKMVLCFGMFGGLYTDRICFCQLFVIGAGLSGYCMAVRKVAYLFVG